MLSLFLLFHESGPPKDLQCETQDMESVVCYWTAGTVKTWNPTEYQLLGRYEETILTLKQEWK